MVKMNMFKAQYLLAIDRFFLLPYKLLWYVFRNLRKYSNIEVKEENHAVMFKFMGMGSIIRIASILETYHVDFNKVVLCTFIQNKEICELAGFKHLIYIRTSKLTYFVTDICRAIYTIRKFKPGYLIDLERCSAAVGIFRILCGGIAGCKTLAMHKQKKDEKGKNDLVWSLESRTYGEALEKISTLLVKEPNLKKPACLYQETRIDKSKILVNMNASAYLPQRKYDPISFAGLIQTLHIHSKEAGYQFYLTGSSEEYNYVQPIVHILKGQAIQAYNVAGKWNLQELMHQLATCKVFITGDSGPMHLAMYMQIPTVVIWGPTHYRYFGYKQNAHTKHISLNKPCSPCFTDPTTKPGYACKGQIPCLSELSPQWIAMQTENWMLQQDLSYRSWIMPRGLRPQETNKKVVTG